jgi:hypothetical protein
MFGKPSRELRQPQKTQRHLRSLPSALWRNAICERWLKKPRTPHRNLLRVFPEYEAASGGLDEGLARWSRRSYAHAGN